MYCMDTFRIQGGDNLASRREARRPGWLVVLWFCLVMATTARPADLNPEDLYQQVLPSVFTLEVETWDGTRVIGSGFLAFEDGMAVTVWHAVRNAKRVNHGRCLPARQCGSDHGSDPVFRICPPGP